jgi:hypothetical protein
MRTILLVCASTLALTAGSFAMGAAPNPVKLALQRADVPSTTDMPVDPDPVDPADLADLDVKGLKGAQYSYGWPAGGGDKHWRLAGAVFVAPSPAGAQALYQHATKLRFGIPIIDLMYPKQPQHQVVLNLPRYGDEQLAIGGDPAGSPAATVYVRKGSIVWVVTIDHFPDAWKVTRTAARTQLQLYANKQAARVAAG